jgi:hypothetical protein
MKTERNKAENLNLSINFQKKSCYSMDGNGFNIIETKENIAKGKKNERMPS